MKIQIECSFPPMRPFTVHEPANHYPRVLNGHRRQGYHNFIITKRPDGVRAAHMVSPTGSSVTISFVGDTHGS